MADLSGKRIAVDISIYLYKYEAENALLENMYVMLSIFRYYNIIPIFIFDGKPPPEKKALLLKRKEDKQEAQEEYDKLKKQLETRETDTDKLDIIASNCAN
jgi:5'-3' exonuclease